MNTDNKVQHTQEKIKLSDCYKKRQLIASEDNNLELPFLFIIEGYTPDEEAEANAEHIVRCWNNHYALLKALKDAHRLLLTNGSIDWWQNHKEEVASISDTIKDAEQTT